LRSSRYACSIRTTRGIGVALFAAMVFAAPACSSDDSPEPTGTGGNVGSGGKEQTGGKPGSSGGNAGSGGVATGGKASGGAGTGGRASGGSGPDPTDGGCSPPRKLYYDTPGCGAAAPAPECGGPEFDACYLEVCSCDGITLTGCGDYSKPWRRTGPCSEGGTRDAGNDASTD
jgi:hypothetical protein